MCGISLVVNTDRSKVDSQFIEKMNELIRHRGPDDEGVKLNGCVGLGHRRLSILDLSTAGHQPMSNYNCDLIFNGEIYNYLELKEELVSDHAMTFTSDSDTEVLLAAYNVWGKKCVDKFNGMWAFVIHDHDQNILFCSRDRFGIKPMVYGMVDQQFILCSESKQFKSFPNFQAKLNKEVAYNYLHHGLLNYSENTFFEGISELRGGHNLTFDLTSMNYEVEKWYSLNIGKHVDLYSGATSSFRKLFQQSVKLRMRSDVKVGSCLSGGLDSTSIVCFASQNFPELETISSCSEYKEYDEQEFIDEVTKKYNVRSNKTYPNLNDLFLGNDFDNIIYHQDQPISSGSNYSEYKVFETAAKNNITVMLDGQGADEYLAGYNEFFVNYWFGLLKKGKLLKCYREMLALSVKRNKSFMSVVRSFLNFLFIYDLKGLLKRILKRDNRIDWLEETFTGAFSSKKRTKKFESLQKLSIDQVLYTSIPYQLHSEDRNSMLHSIESRLPFMDFRLIEECISLPDWYKIDDGRTKSVLRDSLVNDLPDKIIKRYDKMGFVSADEVWIRNNSSEFRNKLQESIESLQGIVNDNLLRHYDKMIANEEGFNNTYFRVIALSKWKTIFKVSI